MRLNALLEGAGCVSPVPQDVEIKGISYDTRTLRPGELFVALRGYKTDGHLHLEEARAKGAAALLALGLEGEELQLTYADSGGDTVQAGWSAREAEED